MSRRGCSSVTRSTKRSRRTAELERVQAKIGKANVNSGKAVGYLVLEVKQTNLTLSIAKSIRNDWNAL